MDGLRDGNQNPQNDLSPTSVALQPCRGQQFTQSPRLEGLLEDLNGVSGPGEASDSGSAFDSELSIPPSNDMESSCAAAPNDWEDRLARQTLDCGE